MQGVGYLLRSADIIRSLVFVDLPRMRVVTEHLEVLAPTCVGFDIYAMGILDAGIN